MTARRIFAAILLSLGLAAAGSAVAASGGTTHSAAVAGAPNTWYHQ